MGYLRICFVTLHIRISHENEDRVRGAQDFSGIFVIRQNIKL